MMGKITMSVLVLVAAVSCRKENTVSLFENKEIILMTEEADFSVETRADVTSLSSLNLMCTSGGAGSESLRWRIDNAQLSSGSVMTGRYWPSQSQYSELGGYHFYCSNSALYIDLNGPKTGSVSNGSDIVCGAVISPEYMENNQFECTHIFSKLGSVTVSAAVSGYSYSDCTISLKNVRTGGVYHLRSGTWTNETDGGDLRLLYVKNARTSAYTSNDYRNSYLVPGTYVISAIYKVKIGNYNYSINSSAPKSASVTLLPGQCGSISVVLPVEEASPIKISVIVEPWINNDYYAYASEWE